MFSADYASALAIELRRGSPPDLRDFLRFKFRNGTEGDFETVHVLGHKSDIPLTEFIYKTQGAQIMNNKHWKDVCGGKGVIETMSEQETGMMGAVLALLLFVGMFAFGFARLRKRRAEKKRRLQLVGEEVSDYGSIYEYRYPRDGDGVPWIS